MRRTIKIAVALAVFAVLACGISYVIWLGGAYPAGTDTMCHVYKGQVLYREIRAGHWYPLYDEFWYNGVQMMRYWAPLPVYFLAMCQWLAGGSAVQGYLVFVALVFFGGAASWLYIGAKKKRILLGAFMGVLWFFMPNNLYALFVEGNLPRALSMVLLPLLLFAIYEFQFHNRWKSLRSAVLLFVGIALCHVGYAGMILLAVLLYLGIYRLVTKEKGRCLPVLCSLVLPFLLIGIWILPSLRGGITSTDSSQVMKTFFQPAAVSLNPFLRIMEGSITFYFGLVAFLLALFGAFFSKKKSIVGFCTAVCIFLCTTKAMYPVLAKLPGSQYLWMLRFISIALCMILMSLMYWKTLRRWILVFFCVLLVADAIPSLSLVIPKDCSATAVERMEETAEESLFDEAKKITKQRMALMDESAMGAMAQYLLTDFGEERVRQTFGAGWQSATTANNIVMLNEALSGGWYDYLFDRALELGNDTVLIQIRWLRDPAQDIEEVTKAANASHFELTGQNGSFLLYHRETPNRFGVVTRYRGIGIGTSAPLLTLCYPDIEQGQSDNLSDYAYEELARYEVIYLDGFQYDEKEEAEEMIRRLSEAGVRIIINGDGIPVDQKTQNQEFLDVICHGVQFENGYPILYTREGELDCNLFDSEYSSWKTVYFTGLDESDGFLYENGASVDFMGTAENENIYFIGLNLAYHYFLTHDGNAAQLFQTLLEGRLEQTPDREVVPIAVTVNHNQIRIRSMRDGVNTSLAYHDIFQSDRKLTVKHQLIHVDQGETVITMHYSYFRSGFLLSVAGLLLTGWFFYWLRKRFRKKDQTVVAEV